ncbi:MAG TPA: hypothetical protein VLN45_01690, partial [Ignavibacteriaceae bacterium]|nr:hypothetical protein [Ignavibacteriaceae bacterium]
MTIKKSIFLILFSTITYFNCNDEPTSIGKDILNQFGDLINSGIISSDSLNQISSYSHPKEVSFSSSERLLLGISDNINASVLIKFDTALPDSIEEDLIDNEITVTSVTVEFHKTYSFGDTIAPFDFTVHKINS